MNEFLPKNETKELGTMENPIVDSQLTKEKALRPNPEYKLPREIKDIFEKLTLLEIVYLSFDGKYHQGQIVIDKELEEDVIDFFNFTVEQNFPINKMVPVADENINFKDDESMRLNNCSGFNPRNIAGTDRPSKHAYGRAIDLNPVQNPFIKNNVIEPKGAVYDVNVPGTLTGDSAIVKFLKDRGWIWGGDYNELKDYHHFEKPLLKEKK